MAVFVLLPITDLWGLEPYKVGAVFSVTGRASFIGDPEKKTVQMLEEHINANGGIDGHPLEVIVYDDRGDATTASTAVRNLITRDRVCAIIGPSLSGASLGVIPQTEEYEIPLISCAASLKIVTKDTETGEQWKWVFKTPPSDSMAAEAIYTHMRNQGISKVAIMSGTTGFGASGRKELVSLAPDFGMTIVADEQYGPQETNLTAQLTRIKEMNPQAIVNWSIGPTEILVVKTWKALDMADISLYQSHGFGSRKNIELAEGAAEGVFCPVGACNIPELLPDNHPQKTVIMEYVNAYTAKYNEPLSSFGAHAWDALSIVVRALDAAGPNKARIREYVENLKGFAGQHGVFNFSFRDHNGLTKEAFEMVVVQDGDWALADASSSGGGGGGCFVGTISDSER